MENFKQIRWIEKLVWLKLDFNKNRGKHPFMQHNVLDDNI
jgi:hypothetical protein